MPEDTPPPLRQLVLVYDLTDPRHRAILRSAAQAFMAGGQGKVATIIWEHLAGSADVIADPEATTELPITLPDYFDGADPAAGWPALPIGTFGHVNRGGDDAA